MSPVVSVIVPVYNVEKYLRQCLLSIECQTITNIEIIVVNDGSSDNSGDIIDEFVKKDDRIIAIHQNNKGYGAAVNSGLHIARGEYISIVEPDDWVENDMIQVLLEGARVSGCNICKCGFKKIYPNDEGHDIYFHFLNGEMRGEVSLADNLELMIFESSIWSALYKRQFLLDNDIKMLETPGASYQDVVWKFMVYVVSDNIFLINMPLYNYRCLVAGSSSCKSDNVEVVFKNYDEIREFLMSRDLFIRYKNAFFVHQMFDFVFHLNRLSFKGCLFFVKLAREVLAESQRHQVSLESIKFSVFLQPYVSSVVFPTCRAINNSYFLIYFFLRKLVKIKKYNRFVRYMFVVHSRFKDIIFSTVRG